MLDDAYGHYQEATMGRKRPLKPPFDTPIGKPFWQDPVTQKIDWTTSIDSFMCTDGARSVYDAASREFDALRDDTSDIDEAKRFFNYVMTLGHRGTPH